MDDESNPAFQPPLVLLPGDVRLRDHDRLEEMNDMQRAEQQRARAALHTYVADVLESAEATGQSWLTDNTLNSWMSLRDLTALLADNADVAARESDAPTVSPEVLGAAWDLVRLLDGQRYGIPPELAGATMQTHVDQVGRPALYRGHLMLVGAVTALLTGDAAEDPPASNEQDVDPLKHLLPAVLLGMPRTFPELDPGALPLIAGALTAAILHQDVLAWAEQHAPEPTNTEALAIAYLVWVLASMHDDAVNEPGATHTLITDMLTSRSAQP